MGEMIGHRYQRLLVSRKVVVSVALLLIPMLCPAVVSANDSPYGFYYGADGNGPIGTGSGYPYMEPLVGGIYGGYVGEVGTWTNWQGCTSGRALNDTAINQVNADEPWPGWGLEIPGVAFYWYAAGPGADPLYNGKYAEAYSWGQAQAARAIWAYYNTLGGYTTHSTHPFMFMDIESPAVGSNGWNHVTDRCGTILSKGVPTHVDRGTVDGFLSYVFANSIFYGGVYSAPAMWSYTFGSGSDASIPTTYEWTYESSTGTATPDPVGFSQSGHGSAQWFGGVTNGYQIGWQWNQTGGDWDQWNAAVFP